MKNILKFFTESRNILGIALLTAALAMVGCAHAPSTDVAELQQQLQQRDQNIKSLESNLKDAEKRAERSALDASRALEGAQVRTKLAPGSGLFPPQATPGQCFARVFAPAETRTVTEQVLSKEASERIEIIPAQYNVVEEQILVKEASTRMEKIPAKYEFVEEKILVEPAHTSWKTGRGLIEKVDNTTGEIMCLVEVPATYKTVKRRVLKSPATSKVIEIPGEYKTVKVRKMVSPPQERRIEIPAEYQTVTRKEQLSEGQLEWRQVLCKTNMTREISSNIQSALKTAGYDPGPIDGLIGHQTLSAVKAYQRDKGLAAGGLTYKTISSLGIQLRRGADIPK